MVRFRCLKKGICCKKYWIPVTHLDLYRLHVYGGIENIEFFIELREADLYSVGTSRFISTIIFRSREYYLSLASLEDGACVFLTPEGLCSVQQYKPLVCRFYPFVYVVKSENEVEIEVNENAIGECPGLILDGKPIPEEIAEPLKRLAIARIRELRMYEEAVREWNDIYGSIDTDLHHLVSFLLEKARIHAEKLRSLGLWIP